MQRIASSAEERSFPTTPAAQTPQKPTPATPPRGAFAFDTSIRRIRACACGLRRNPTSTMNGSTMSETYCPSPVRRRWSSLRGTDRPIHFVFKLDMGLEREPLRPLRGAHRGDVRDRLLRRL